MSDPIDVAAMALGAIGQPVRRKEDQRLLTGKGRFTDDFDMPGQAYAVMVRSPYPHARILEIEMDRTRNMPGVLGVFSGKDCLADGLGPIPHSPVPSTRYDLKLTGPLGGTIFIGSQPLLPVDRVRHVGEAVAMVVAETLPQALDATEGIEVEYEQMPWVESSKSALSSGAPAIWDEVRDNVLVDTMFGDREATDRAFAAADHIVEMNIHIGRVTGVPIEPRAALGYYDAASDRYTLYAGSGGPVRQKTELAAVLGVDPQKVRVLSHDVGGNFGVRNRVFVEFGLVLWAARKLGRPVKYTATRPEAFLSDFQGRDLVTKVALALRADGRFLGMRADNISNVGGRCVSIVAARQGVRIGHRLVRHSGGEPALARGIYQHDADQRLSQLGPPRGDLCDRAANRQGCARARVRSRRLAPQEPRRAANDALPQCGRRQV
jgi:aerobic carbon-monoxide dehydrogenase large subunit